VLTGQVLGTDPPDFGPIGETQCRNKRKKQRGQATFFLTEHIPLRHQLDKNISFALWLLHVLFLCVCLFIKSQMIGNLPVSHHQRPARHVGLPITQCMWVTSSTHRCSGTQLPWPCTAIVSPRGPCGHFLAQPYLKTKRCFVPIVTWAWELIDQARGVLPWSPQRMLDSRVTGSPDPVLSSGPALSLCKS